MAWKRMPTGPRDVHVTYSREDTLHGPYRGYRWHVRSDADRLFGARGIFRGKREAMMFGRALARKLKTALYIHNFDGSIACQGYNANAPKGKKRIRKRPEEKRIQKEKA